MEERFIKMGFLFMGGIISLCLIGMALEQHERSQCRIAAIQSNKSSVEIESICK